MTPSDTQKQILAWATAIAVSLVVIAIGWSFRPNDDNNDPVQAPVAEADQPEATSDQSVEIEQLDTVTLDVEATTAELAQRVAAFEAGYRSVYQDDSPDSRRQRVNRLVEPSTLDYLNFEQAQPLGAETLSYDIIAEAIDPEAVIDGLWLEVVQGEVVLVIEVSYTRVEADGSSTELGTLPKRSRWEYIDNQWLLTGADT